MWTFGKRMGLGFVLSFTVLILIGAVALQGIQQAGRNSQLVSQSHETLEATTGILSALKDAETGQRGFLLSGDENYLQPFKAGSQAVQRYLGDLERSPIGRGNPENIRTLRQLTADLLALHEQRIEMRRQKPLEEVLVKVRTGEGKRRMDQLRQILGDIETRTRQELTERSEETAAAEIFVTRVVILGTLVGLAVVIVAWLLLQRQLTGTVTQAASEVQSQATELETTSDHHANTAGETATSVNEASASVHELLMASRQIALRAQQISDVAMRNGEMAHQGRAAVEAHSASVTSMQRQVDRVVQGIVGLGKKAQTIGGIVGLVEDLAEKTNILAINATIEAEAVGDHGQRFSVVADEIRQLADNMREASRDIRLQLDDVQGAANTTVMATEAGAKAVETSAAGFGSILALLSEVGDRVVSARAAAAEIQVATQQQSAALEQLEMVFTTVAQSSREAKESSAQNRRSATLLAGSAARLMAFVAAERSTAT
ncbi:Methyl-accepting chemotaxis protein (MCP) signalling domain-containing protein [Roseateles sp. YR242]|uniref:CHASE3 domain-containing protein n=1 Tax=Roseateles sp. YR242 TaxID=1855305 RepID=UPI0008BD7FC8|nr:CHASE3 domain-containing protein [Roseateles sp. YR242]SEL23354.1 Methyl-accepting chemotaxis protein (MCP) signalling domain-containing protein [Roseateles sp. YR242]